MATNKKNLDDQLDEAKLRQIDGPLYVSLNRLVGGRPEPITMFSRAPGEPPGRGFTHDDIVALPNGVLRHSGGGRYRVTVSNDQNVQYTYGFWLDPEMYPQKIPQSMAAAYAAAPAPAQPTQQGVAMSTFSLESVTPGVVPVRPGQAAPQPTQTYSQPTLVPTGGGSDDRMRALEEQLRRTEEERRREREEAIKKEAAYEREKLQAEHTKNLARLEEEVRRLSERAATPPAGESESVKLMREQNERLMRSLEEMKATRAQDAQAQQNQQMMAMFMEMQKQTQQLMLTMSQKPAVDPMVQMMIEQQRQQSEMQREALRVQAEQARERERSAMTPKDLVEMANTLRQANGGQDQLLKSVSEAYMGIFTMHKHQAELMMQMQQGPSSPAVEMIGNALQGLQGMAQGYFQMKTEVAQAEAQMKVAEARALAPQPQAPPPQAAAPRKKGKVVPLRPVDAPPPPAEPGTKQAQLEEMEQKMFGLPKVIEAVRRLRVAVAEGKYTADDAVGWVRQALGVIQQMNARQHVPVLQLLENGMVDDFVRTLVPEAPQAFIIDFVRKLTAALSNPNAPAAAPATAASAPASASAEMEEEDEEDEEEDEEENAPA